jgi:lysozyme
MARMINSAGLALIKEYEGLRLEAYEDGAGVWTIGFGSTGNVHKGDTISAEQAEMRLEASLIEVEQAVSRIVKVPLTDNQFSALVCFAYNVGSGALEKSTLLKKLNEGGYDLVPSYLKSWIFAGGKVERGLVKRRAAEAALWMMP